jgi:LEA14-like dessication related protein
VLLPRLGAVGLVLVLAGCQALKDMGKALAPQTPDARVEGLSLTGLEATRAHLLVELTIDNPYGVALPLADLAYGLDVSGTRLLEGDVALDGSVPAGGERTLQLPLTVGFNELFSVLSEVRAGQVLPCAADLTLAVDAPAVGRLELPLEAEGELPIPAPPTVEVLSLEMGDSSFTKLAGVLRLGVTNPNGFAVDVDRLDYALSLGGSQVLKTGLDGAASLEAGAETDIGVPFELSLLSLGSAVVSLLGGDGADYALTGTADLKTPWGPLAMPFATEGNTTFQ